MRAVPHDVRYLRVLLVVVSVEKLSTCTDLVRSDSEIVTAVERVDRCTTALAPSRGRATRCRHGDLVILARKRYRYAKSDHERTVTRLLGPREAYGRTWEHYQIVCCFKVRPLAKTKWY